MSRTHANKLSFHDDARFLNRKVFYTGTGALERGVGLCYDQDRGTATSVDDKRDVNVELPGSGTQNNLAFAGVTVRAYENAEPNGQWVEIHEPGGLAYISTNLATVVNATRLTCSAGTGNAGRFHTAGFSGRGTALALQTKAALSATGSTPGVLGSLLDGSALVSTTPWKTISNGGTVFANAQAGDYVFVLGGHTDATGVTVLTPQRHTIASVTSDAIAVMTDAVATVDSNVSLYVVRGNPVVLALLQDGEESGLTEWITPDSATAVASMISGMTFIHGGSTGLAADSTFVLADGTFSGQTKGFKLMGALTTSDYVVTVTSGLVIDPTAASLTLSFGALATATLDGANDSSTFTWKVDNWVIDSNVGTALA